MLYVLEIEIDNESVHELQFQRKDFDFSDRLFAIMDTESRGQVSKATVKDFVTLRCPVFWRRDNDLRSIGGLDISPTFEEVWRSVATCSSNSPTLEDPEDFESIELGIEGWMVFCRFIALAQYLEAKRRFSGRHLQQTMRQRNSPRGSELVMVDVPPEAPPLPLSARQLAQYERESYRCLPLPELDLDHSLLAAHDVLRRRKDVPRYVGRVKIDLFGSAHSLLTSGSSVNSVEFCLTYLQNGEYERISVRRSMNDMKWLNDTFISHKALGGTLCGRILPPFPGKVLAAQFHSEESLSSTSGAIVAAANAGVGVATAGVDMATAGVGMIRQGIKSLWGSYITVSERTAAVPGKKSGTCLLPESYYNPNSPAGKARRLERYLNYLLEHPALSTSFPLNTILKASQSGLEAAKQSLEEHTRASKEIKEQTPKLDDGKLSSFWPLHASGSPQPNLSWVRTAAQAAVALRLHGVLETSGLPSASARLQHASLPTFDNSRKSAWNDDDGDWRIRHDSDVIVDDDEEECFEEGVMQVKDELEEDDFVDDSLGYDLLPLPVPAPERQVLAISDTKKGKNTEQKEARFRYGSPTFQERLLSADSDETQSAYVGEIAVDENIDKLREIIGSVDNTLSRCWGSSGGIGKARRENLDTHLQVLRGLDSWEGLRGKFVSQRALLKGVSGIEQSKGVFDESDLALIDDLSWQATLASSAVSAAEDVRSTVRAARTAANAKAAASSAAKAAQTACEKSAFGTIDEARAAQTRASIAQSHAMHAAVVEHEAKTVKRRATLALAHDVKCWNAHRKRETLQTVLSYAKSQHEATRRAVDAWSCLRDGFVGSTVIPSTQGRRAVSKPLRDAFNDDVTTTIFGNGSETGGQQMIVAVEHNLLKQSNHSSTLTTADVITSSEPETILPLVVASPIPEEEEDVESSREQLDFGISSSSLSAVVPVDPLGLAANDNSPSSTGSNVQSKSRTDEEKSVGFTGNSMPSKSAIDAEKLSTAESGEAEALTSSMQSLVNGLMNWGGQYDDEEDFALPTGMAASIALEESGVFGTTQKIEPFR